MVFLLIVLLFSTNSYAGIVFFSDQAMVVKVPYLEHSEDAQIYGDDHKGDKDYLRALFKVKQENDSLCALAFSNYEKTNDISYVENAFPLVHKSQMAREALERTYGIGKVPPIMPSNLDGAMVVVPNFQSTEEAHEYGTKHRGDNDYLRALFEVKLANDSEVSREIVEYEIAPKFDDNLQKHRRTKSEILHDAHMYAYKSALVKEALEMTYGIGNVPTTIPESVGSCVYIGSEPVHGLYKGIQY